MSPGKGLLILVGALLLFGAVFGLLEQMVGVNLQGNLVEEEGSIQVVFCPAEDCERTLLDVLGKADEISCAFYDLDLATVGALLASKNAKTLVFEENALEEFQSIPSMGLMHHKFCVLDGNTVITGSMNPTENGVRHNDNNLIIIESPTITRRYSTEFLELSKREGEKYAKQITSPRYVNLSGTLIELRFCPQENCERVLLKELGSAKHAVQFMTFTFTSDPVGDALIDAAERGVAVQGVFEARQNPQYSEFERLQDWGLEVRVDGNPKTMHHKVFIIDNRTVITGSYNPTASANERNDENLLIIDDKTIAREFLSEFERVWNLSAES